MYLDQYYLILVLPTILLSGLAQILVKSTFAKYSKQASRKGISGAQAAQLLMRANNITNVRIERVAGQLTDHYSPGEQVLRLSEPVYGQTSIAAVGVAAHETGHAIQHDVGYAPLWMRSTLVPVANIGSQFGPILAIAGLVLSFGVLIDIGLVLFAASVAFYVITLPVEFNASHRAIKILRSTGSLDEEELRGVKKVLTAAAMTYVASALTAIASFLRLALITRNRRND
ncbi:MAG: zinc metallopeptidase [Treponemataceae bacterium]|nr:zinc metallopeptidase [Treponemataceae bacterium]